MPAVLFILYYFGYNKKCLLKSLKVKIHRKPNFNGKEKPR